MNNNLSPDEYMRYNRQIIMPEIGEQGQKKLKAAKVFIAGLGGLGSVSAFYMAAAGIGTLKLVDKDQVKLDNLNRQILHQTHNIGKPKTISASEKLQALNPLCHIQAIQQDIQDENIIELTGGCNIIIDGTDNPETRKILNKLSVLKRIPFVYGGISGFNGTVTTFIPGKTPCLECLFPDLKTASADKKDNTGSIGVIGPAAALVASIQSMEAIKIILGMNGLLKSRLLCIQGADMTFRTIAIEKNPECRVCSSVLSKFN